jgi:hypothetical protein
MKQAVLLYFAIKYTKEACGILVRLLLISLTAEEIQQCQKQNYHVKVPTLT